MNLYQNQTDLELVAALLQGEEKAFEAIYFRYVKVLVRYARKRISNKDDCFEIVQEVFESLWSRHSELSNITLLEAYLYRMVKYKIIRYYQHNNVIQKYTDHFKAFETIIDDGEEEKEIETLREVINTTLAELPERCQVAVRLRIDENLSNGDIAKRMNIDKSTVKRYITAALSYFKEKHPPLYKAR
jgi:RNA polymerase sigma-70 factor (ECF subfamily)